MMRKLPVLSLSSLEKLPCSEIWLNTEISRPYKAHHINKAEKVNQILQIIPHIYATFIWHSPEGWDEAAQVKEPSTRLSLYSSSLPQRRRAAPFQSFQPDLHSIPIDPRESHNMVTWRALSLPGFIERKCSRLPPGSSKKKKKCWFWSSLICFRWSGISHMFCYQSIILMSCSCVDTFCNERSSVESEQHLIKSVCVKQHCAKRTSKDVIIIPRQMMSPCRKTEMPNLLFIF